MPRRQYAPVPSSQGDAEDADRQIEDAFDISDEDHDESQNHDNTPLLARHPDAEARTPHTSRTPVTRPTTSAGLYNFDYDFPPSGSPPADLAIPNSWGNTNGVIVSNPVNYNHNAQGNWAARVWRRVVGGRQGVDPDIGRIGGGTNNDGVFSNLSSRPTARINRPSTVAQNGAEADESIFHAPELARDDAPPSYAAAQADTAPPYWENTVLATTPDDFLIDSIPAGSIMAFIWSLAISVFLEWIGFILAYMLSQSHAGRYGAKAGLGITFVRLGLWFRARGRNWNGNSIPEEMWWGTSFGNGTMPNGTHITPLTQLAGASNLTAIPRHHETDPNWNSTIPHLWNSTLPGHAGGTHHTKVHFTEWLALFLMTIGWFIFMSSLLGFWRVKRWERSIRASTQPRVVTPEQQEQEREVFTNLQTSIGTSFVIRTPTHAQQPRGEHQDEADLEDVEHLASTPLEGEHRQLTEEQREALRFENRLRRDLSNLGYL